MKAIITHWLDALRASLVLALTPSPVAESVAPITPQWSAMLGDTIELGTSGFTIRLEPKRGCPAYTLYSPEGELMARSPNMQALKEYGERSAAWRAEFMVTPERCAELKAVLASQAMVSCKNGGA